MFPLLPALSLLLAANPQSELEAHLKRFIEVYALVEQHAAEPVVPDRAIYEGALPGLLRQLDPHSVFFNADHFEQLKEMEKSTHKGFGSVVSVLPGRVIILQTLPATPSERAGLLPGDEIMAINRIPLARLDMEQLVGLLSESRQQPASLDVRRQNTPRLLQFTLTPEDVRSASVDRAFLLRPGAGYVRVTSFESETGAQLKAAIEKLGGAALKALVLDLRGNPGGLMPAALETAAMFLKPRQRIVTVRGRSKVAEDIDVPPSAPEPYAFPLAVLIDAKSASASEIVSGAMQDHDRAVIIGEQSFGKGLVQSVYPLTGSNGLALTTAFYYSPSGRNIQRPLSGGQLHPSVETKPQVFRSDSGRALVGGWGIVPDRIVLPEASSRLRIVLDASGSFTSFATELARRQPVRTGFDVTPAVLDEFQGYLSQRNILPGVAEWSRDRDWIRSRLKQEIFNQTLGVDKGDEVEAERDPQIRRALEELKVQ